MVVSASARLARGRVEHQHQLPQHKIINNLTESLLFAKVPEASDQTQIAYSDDARCFALQAATWFAMTLIRPFQSENGVLLASSSERIEPRT